MAYMHVRGINEERLKALCDDETRKPTDMVNRLILLAYRRLKSKDGGK